MPENIDRVLTINLQKPLELIKSVKCLKCGRFCHKNNFQELKYWEIIKEKENLLEIPSIYFKHVSSLEMPVYNIRDVSYIT